MGTLLQGYCLALQTNLNFGCRIKGRRVVAFDHCILREKSLENPNFYPESSPNLDSQIVPYDNDPNQSPNYVDNGMSATYLDAVRDVAAASLEFLSLVRWGAANALTASLPEDQREELLRRMVTQRSFGDEIPASPREAWMVGRGSIQEEIAVSLAEEARSRMNGGEFDQATHADEIEKQIEDAARARVESEFLVQKMRFEQDIRKIVLLQNDPVEQNLRKRGDQIEVERERMTKLEQDIEEIRMRRPADDGINEKSGHNGSATREKLVTNLVHIHPLLGPVLKDLGYKQLYLVQSEKLGTIPVWNKNRIYRHSRAQLMASDKLKSMHLGFPGVVCLHEDTDGKLSILDGQHRVGMMTALKETRRREAIENNSFISEEELAMFDNILVEVYRQDPDSGQSAHEHAEQVFLEINKSEPVKLVDMPGVAPTIDRAVITEAVDLLRNRYPNMFSPSQNCYLPNVNEDNLRNNIFGANVLNRHKLRSSQELLEWLLLQNDALEFKYQHNEENRMLVSKRAWKKTSENSFYLGLESSWLYQ